jgi:hypothetical protein
MAGSRGDEQRRLKKFLTAGALLGAFFSIGVSLLMDPLYSDALGGTWRDAIVGDLQNFLSISVGKESFLVTVVFIFILTILGVFGALMGLIFTFFVYRFFHLLVKE